MTDDRVILPNHTQQRQTFQRNSISLKLEPSRKVNMTTDHYYSNRNCPEILTLIALKNKHLENREKQIYRSVTTDTYEFDTINYPLQSPPPTPIPPLQPQNTMKQQQQPMFPKLTSKSPTTTSVKKFPTLTARSASVNAYKKVPMPTIKSSQKPVPPSSHKPIQTKMAVASTYQKKKRFQSSHHVE